MVIGSGTIRTGRPVASDGTRVAVHRHATAAPPGLGPGVVRDRHRARHDLEHEPAVGAGVDAAERPSEHIGQMTASGSWHRSQRVVPRDRSSASRRQWGNPTG